MTPYPYELATPEQRAIGSLWWCIHHQIKLEPLTEPVENRVKAIRETKAAHEQETRLRAMRPVIGPIPEPVQQASAAYWQASAACQQADAACQQASAAWQQAYAAYWQAYAAWQQADTACQQADAAYQQASAAWQQAYAAYWQAYAAWQQALAGHATEVDALFAVECADVQWGPEGLVFPKPERA
jgi:hypothetical protein